MDARIDWLQRQCASKEDVRTLAGGLPADELFPRQALELAFPRALASSTVPALQYGWPEGAAPLREWIAERLRRRGAAVTAEDVIVTAGAQQGLAIATEALGSAGAAVAVDRESYPAALDRFRSVDLVPTPALEGAFAYAMPAIANPHGRPATRDRSAALLGSGLPIVEDDAYAELRFDGDIARPYLADAPDRVWHVGTVSKTLCPGLRLGWLIPPRASRTRALEIKQTQDLQAASMAQALLVETLPELDFDAHLARARRVYSARAEALMSALRRTLPSWRFEEPAGGFSVFVETGESGDDRAFLAVAAAHGVSFDPGRLFRWDGAGEPLALRLCYSASNEADLNDAVARLARAWEAFTKSRRERRPDNLRGWHSST